jgi:hypothetical protein
MNGRIIKRVAGVSPARHAKDGSLIPMAFYRDGDGLFMAEHVLHVGFSPTSA